LNAEFSVGKYQGVLFARFEWRPENIKKLDFKEILLKTFELKLFVAE
jgi:hypothetical protein